MLKSIGIILLALILIALVFILGYFWYDAKVDKYNLYISEEKIPLFTKVPLPFSHQYDFNKSLPIAPSAAIDLDNDGSDEIFFGGGLHQEDKIFKFMNDQFIDITQQTNLKDKGLYATICVATADFDNNGFQDMMVGREDGLHIYYNENGKFIHKIISTPLNSKSTISGIALGDIDKDGDIDVFLSAYIKKDLMRGQTIFEDYTYGATSELLRNDGNDFFLSITQKAGLDYVHNTFLAVLIDVDEDGDLDLVVAHDTGEVRIYKNNGNSTFTMIDNPLTGKFAYPMGIAVGDYNNDGKIDFAFSNTGSTLPRFLAKGDIQDASRFNEKYLLFENLGDMKFVDVAKEAKIADYEFGWGLVFADMNNDGLQDLIVAENYVDFFPDKIFRLPGRLLIQRDDNSFVSTESKSGVINPYFGISPLVSDFNLDGCLDLIWTNINSPSIAFISKGNSQNFINVHLPKNARTIGTIVNVTLPSGRKLTDHLVTSEGLGGDQSATLHFGLGEETSILNVTLKYLDGTVDTIANPQINGTLSLQGQK